jgi:hypothetical protein
MKSEVNWEKFLNKIKPGQEYSVAPNWSEDNWRKKINRLARKGYFKKIGRSYGGKKRAFADWFIRTNKKWIDGDCIKKPISFSKQKIKQMSTATQELPSTKVVTGTVRFSYLHIWEPSAINDSQDKKYSASLIIPKDDKVTINKIKRAIEAAKEQGKAKFGGKIPANLKTPLRDGDEERPEDEAYKNAYFINANAKMQPGVIDKAKNKILDKDELYSGCYGLASITFYAFNTSGNKGIACGLNNIMKTKDGEPLSGRASAEEDFAEVADGEDDDLM